MQFHVHIMLTKRILHLINCQFSLFMLKLHCVFTGSLSEVKTEADNNDMTEHPHLDTTKPYLCTVCHKRFTSLQNLNMHSKTHTGENVYSCCAHSNSDDLWTVCDTLYKNTTLSCQEVDALSYHYYQLLSWPQINSLQIHNATSTSSTLMTIYQVQ